MNEPPVWSPSAERAASTRMRHFLDEVAREEPTFEPVQSESASSESASAEAALTAYDALWRWSIAHPGRFWSRILDASSIELSQPARAAFEPAPPASASEAARRPMRDARFFPGAQLNFARALLSRRGDDEAIVAWSELSTEASSGSAGTGSPRAIRERSLSWDELHHQVERCAAALAEVGVEPGDRVAGVVSNVPEAIIAMLASTRLGAVWSSCSPDFGVSGILDRFGQIEPTVLFAVDGYRFGGKDYPTLANALAVLDDARLASVRRLVVVPRLASLADGAGIDVPERDDVTPWDEFLESASAAPAPPFHEAPFDHPAYILYSSGTTGLPKCIVHGQGGTLLQHWKELALHTDVRAGDRVFYFTTCGWMMWNWLVSSLSLGATVVLWDGSPFAPTSDVLWDLAEAERLNVFGTSAKYLALFEKALSRDSSPPPRESHDLGALRVILSTGSPLLPESYDFVYRDIAPDVQLASISGGTDIVSCFALGNPMAPVWRGELQSRGLGMAVEVWDEDGRPVVGEPGELVCVEAFPSMPVGFWNDPDGARYDAAYFDHWPGVWRHGDWAEVTDRGGMVLYGRSDATLNPGGVRLGTAEIYRVVERFEEVLEALVIGQRHEGDVRVVLFVRLREGEVLEGDAGAADRGGSLSERLRSAVRREASPFHVPKRIVAVDDLPRTRSGKLSELAVRDIVHGREPKNVGALANPESLALFRDLAALRE